MTIDKKYLVYGMAALAATILVGAFIYWWVGGDSTTAITVGSGGALIAGDAERRRRQARAEVDDAAEEVKDSAEKVKDIHDKAEADMKAEADKVAAAGGDDKVKDGNELFS